ncbi:hypothetical protein NYV35_17550 [Escherichia coli]|nr:hypothetical protein [Escherichia coli]
MMVSTDVGVSINDINTTLGAAWATFIDSCEGLRSYRMLPDDIGVVLKMVPLL